MEILAVTSNRVCTQEGQCTEWKAAVVWGRGVGAMTLGKAAALVR
jgi:hypothetical protein